ncbi:MAG: hypothetical protein HC904_16310 [Blastochloris sp.]|nr:hypothetical protein [Blastochloris sp.]
MNQLGVRVQPVSSVGDDFLGSELLRRVRSWGLSEAGISVQPGLRTGAVVATLSEGGSASYDILEPAAWDRIESPPFSIKGPELIVFGTLAQRSEWNRRCLRDLFQRYPGARKIYDVNLRPPYDRAEWVRELMALADVVKLNDEELARLSPAAAGSCLEKQTAALSRQIESKVICVTAGARGAGLWQEGVWHWSEGEKWKLVTR